MKHSVENLLRRRSQLLEIIASAADEVNEIDKQLKAIEPGLDCQADLKSRAIG